MPNNPVLSEWISKYSYEGLGRILGASFIIVYR